MFGKYTGGSDGIYEYCPTISNTIRLYWDNAEKAVYAGIMEHESSEKTLVADLDDSSVMGSNVFKGFSTGEIIVSVCFETIDSHSNLMLLNIDGIDRTVPHRIS